MNTTCFSKQRECTLAFSNTVSKSDFATKATCTLKTRTKEMYHGGRESLRRLPFIFSRLCLPTRRFGNFSSRKMVYLFKNTHNTLLAFFCHQSKLHITKKGRINTRFFYLISEILFHNINKMLCLSFVILFMFLLALATKKSHPIL